MTDFERFPFLRPAVAAERPTLCALAAEARARLRAAEAVLTREQQAWLAEAPLALAVETFDAYRRASGYSVLAAGVSGFEARILSQAGEAWRACYSRLLLLELLARLPERELRFSVPALLWDDIEAALRLLLDGIHDLEVTSWNDGDFRKDVSAAQLRTLPFQGMITEVRRLNPWHYSREARPMERLALLRYLGRSAFRTEFYSSNHGWRGFREFRKMPWDARYEPIAAFYEVNSRVAGYMGGGWTYDPALERITPHIAIRATEMLQAGAIRFRAPTDAESVRLALVASAERQRLHAEGLYRPTSYALMFKRSVLLDWAWKKWRAVK